MACATVVPVPRPTAMPSVTYATAASPAIRLGSSDNAAATGPTRKKVRHASVRTKPTGLTSYKESEPSAETMTAPPGHVTVNQRILVHLLAYTNVSDRDSVPPAVTQQGIADAVGVRRSHVTLALQM